MRIFRALLYMLLVLVGAFLLFLIYATLDDFRPQDETSESIIEQSQVLSDSAQLDLLIWNIGYAGLDASMDFFYDGGKSMRPSEEGVSRNLEGITSTLSPYVNYDFVLLQEVDRDSKRSYYKNQVQTIEADFPHHTTYFGMNYDVFFVPIPLFNPMGKVESGLMTLTKHTPTEVTRFSFPGNYSWPMKLFMLDRCFLVNRHPVTNGKELVIINTHNSAYDDGSLRSQQMDFLKKVLLEEYKLGNYVIVGGGLEPDTAWFQTQSSPSSIRHHQPDLR